MPLAFDDYRQFDATGLAAGIRRGDFTGREVVAAALERISAINARVNAVSWLDPRVVGRDDCGPSSDPDVRAGAPFCGVPYLIKDLHAPVAGMPLTHGSRLFAGQVHDFDSETVSRLRRAGFVLLGRSNAPEFGMNVTTEPTVSGITRNPWDTDHSAGGSSGGAGAAVASGMLPAAHATDSGGSIRIPASCNGLVGLKPTRGLLPTGPHRGDANHGISHEHAVTRTVRDCAAILDVTAGPDVGAAYFTAKPAQTYAEAIQRPPARLRVAYVTRTFAGDPIDPVCARAVEACVRVLDGLGHHVASISPTFDAAALNDAWTTLLMPNLAALVDARVATLGRPLRYDDLEPVTHEAVAFGRNIDGPTYAAQFGRINREVRRIGQFFSDIDILVTPTLAAPPLPIGKLSMHTMSFPAFRDAMSAYTPFSSVFNLTGQPAISLPLDMHRGLPIGVQLAAGFGQDALLLQLAAELEAAAPWRDRVAPI